MRILKEENLGTMPNETEINMMFYNSDARQHDHNIYRCSICITGYGSTLYIGIAIYGILYSPHTLGNSVLTFTFKSF